MSPRRSQSSRERLIQSAAELFYEHGIHRTSVDKVVARAGLTKPTFYQHFPSKDDLVTAVVSHRSDNWRRAFEERISAASTPRRRLSAVFEFLEDFIADQPFRGCALVNASVEILSAADPGRQIARRNKQANRRRIEKLAREAGLAEPAILASALSFLFEGAIVTAYVESDRNAGRAARRAAERLIRSHRRQQQRSRSAGARRS